MKQAEIWEMYFNPVKGSEQSGRRPAVIISGNVLNDNLNIVIVCPLTTKIKAFKGNIILQPNSKNNLLKESEILTFHVHSVSKERLKQKIGVISKKDLQQIHKTLNDILRY